MLVVSHLAQLYSFCDNRWDFLVNKHHLIMSKLQASGSCVVTFYFCTAVITDKAKHCGQPVGSLCNSKYDTYEGHFKICKTTVARNGNNNRKLRNTNTTTNHEQSVCLNNVTAAWFVTPQLCSWGDCESNAVRRDGMSVALQSGLMPPVNGKIVFKEK